MTWLTEVEGQTTLERVVGKRPELVGPLREFASAGWTSDAIDPVLLELCRLTIARVHGSRSDLALRHDVDVPRAKVEALDDFRRSDLFTEHERSCLALAEQFTIDPHGVSDADFAAVADQLSPAAVVALVYSLAVFDGLTRLRAILEVEPEPVPLVPPPDPARALA